MVGHAVFPEEGLRLYDEPTDHLCRSLCFD